jgi:hypothetical protein
MLTNLDRLQPTHSKNIKCQHLEFVEFSSMFDAASQKQLFVPPYKWL